MKAPALALILIACLGLTAAAGEEVFKFKKEVPLDPDGSFSLSNVSGSIVVKGWDQAKVAIEADKLVRGGGDPKASADAVEIDVRGGGRSVTVETRYPKSGSWGGLGEWFSFWGKSKHVTVNYRIMVPKKAAVQVEAVSGEIEASGLLGRWQSECVSGDVRLSDLSGGVRLESVSGDVKLRNVRGAVDVESVSGGIHVIGGDGDFSGETVSGDIEISDRKGRRVGASSVSGDLTFSGVVEAGGSYEFECQSGDIELTVLGSAGFRFEGETFSGDIDVGPGLELSDVRRERKRLSGTYGDGSARITCDTFSGDVTLTRAEM